MGALSPVAFDIETTGLDPAAELTVAGFATEVGAWLGLNTAGRDADGSRLEAAVAEPSGATVRVTVVPDETSLLERVASFATERIDADRQYLTAYNGERWRDGFDLPFLRRACARRAVEWPFADVAYADTMDAVERFHTGGASDLAGVYDALVGGDHPDPFGDSASAVARHEAGDWVPLLLHNLADVERTRELAVLAGRYVPKSDFRMKSLRPPER